MKYSYKTEKVCPMQIDFVIEENKIIELDFLGGGCQGNLNALKKVIIGKEVDKVIELFSGNLCGKRGTSCMDQLAKALEQTKVNNQ